MRFFANDLSLVLVELLLLELLLELVLLLAFCSAAFILANCSFVNVEHDEPVFSLPPGVSQLMPVYMMAYTARPMMIWKILTLDLLAWSSLPAEVRYWMPATDMPMTPSMPTPMDNMSTTRFNIVNTPQPSPSSLILPKKVVSTTVEESVAKVGWEKRSTKEIAIIQPINTLFIIF